MTGRDRRAAKRRRRASTRAGGALLAACALGAATLGPTSARADPPPRVRFALVRAPGAEGCPDAAAIAADVAARLRTAPFDPAADRAIDVIVTREADGYHARLLVREALDAPPAVRELASAAPACDELADGVALLTALAIDPNAPLGPRPRAPRPAAPAPAPRPVPAPAAPRSPAPPRPAVAPSRPDPGAWDARTRVALGAGVALGPVPGLDLALAWGVRTPRYGPLRVVLDAWLLPETRTADQSFAFGLAAGSAGVCLGTASGRFAIDGCLDVLAGVLHGAPRVPPLIPENPGDYVWLAVAPSARGALRLVDPLALELRLEPMVPVLHHRFVLRRGADLVPVFETSYVAFFATIGLSARFP